MGLRLVPVTLAEANELVAQLHRHHAPAVGHRWSIGCAKDGKLVGAIICGRTVARMADDGLTCEALRVVTDGTKNACSMLYAAGARAGEAMGYDLIQTYILDEELGTSLKAAGWEFGGYTSGGDWNHRGAEQKTLWGDFGRRTDQPQGPKQRWFKRLRKIAPCRERRVISSLSEWGQ